MPITVAIIGAGPLGRWLALAAASAGFRVLLEDVMPANLHHAQEFLRRELGPEALAAWEIPSGAKAPAREGLHTYGLKPVPFSPESVPSSLKPVPFSPESVPSSLKPVPFSGVAFVSTIEDAVREADLAIDCVPDELESKLEIFCLLDRMAPPRTVLATPTTRLSIADLAACTYRAGQCVAIVAEASSLAGSSSAEILLRTTSRTTTETVALVRDFWERVGFKPRFEVDPEEPGSPG